MDFYSDNIGLTMPELNTERLKAIAREKGNLFLSLNWWKLFSASAISDKDRVVQTGLGSRN